MALYLEAVNVGDKYLYQSRLLLSRAGAATGCTYQLKMYFMCSTMVERFGTPRGGQKYLHLIIP